MKNLRSVSCLKIRGKRCSHPTSHKHSTRDYLFDRYLDKKNVFSWNSLIAELSRDGDSVESVLAFFSMRKHNVRPNRASFPCMIKACADSGQLYPGVQAHQQALGFGYVLDLFVSSALIDLYSKCGRLSDARDLFDEIPVRSIVTWTAMIAGCVHNGVAEAALSLFKQLLAGKDGENPEADESVSDSVAISTVLAACSRCLQPGFTSGVHGFLVKQGMDKRTQVDNNLLAAYAKSGQVIVARKVFDEMSERDVVSWNSMIAAYAQNGSAYDAFSTFGEMLKEEDGKFTLVTLSTLLLACAHSGSLQFGKCIHDQVMKMGVDQDIIVGTALVDMYCKSGQVEMARGVFDGMSNKNVKTWTAMISGYGLHGRAHDALDLFDNMLRVGVLPNYVTFVSVLGACSHAGLLDEAWHWFNSMKLFDLEPGVEHYSCMVDLLGRAGYLNSAYDLIKKMKSAPDFVLWGSLLAACRTHKNVEMAEDLAREIFKLDPGQHGYYVLLANLYAESGRWMEVENTRQNMKARGLMKCPGYSMVELRGRVHVFLVGDKDHAQQEMIHKSLEGLMAKLLEAGYVPDTSSVVHDVDGEEKEMVLRVHSEKLAVVFGVMNTTRGAIIHVIKNLRVCADCHAFIKVLSKVVDREIVVRDAKRFHHFKGGSCSCGDYW